MHRLALTAIVLPLLLAGCVDSGGLGQLQGEVSDPTIEWGQAAQFTIENVGQGPVPAPVRVQVVAVNGTAVHTWEDVTGGHGIPPNGQVSIHWNGLNDAGRPVLWGNYTIEVPGAPAHGRIQVLRPPNYAINVDPDPKQTQAGQPVTFQVRNTGTVWLNGSLTVAAGRQGNILYNNTVHVRLGPADHYNMTWNGHDPDGEAPEAQRYVVAARMELDDGPKPFAQDWFELTEPSAG